MVQKGTVSAVMGTGLLEILSTLYIFLPVGLFFYYYLTPIYAALFLLLLVIGMAWSVVAALRMSDAAPATSQITDGTAAWRRAVGICFRHMLLLGLGAVVVLTSGIGGFTQRYYDAFGYDSVMRDLIELPLPAGYAELGEARKPAIPIYYVGHWLPSVVVGRIWGWNAAYVFYYFWAVIGVYLTVLWFQRIVGSRAVWVALLFLSFGGLDLLGYLATAQLPHQSGLTWLDYLTATYWWSIGRGWWDHWTADFAFLSLGKEVMKGVFYRFYSLSSFLFDGPYHYLPGFLIFLMILYDLLRRHSLQRAGFLFAAFPISSLFMTLGKVPFLALAAVQQRFRRVFSGLNLICGAGVMLPLVLYYASLRTQTQQGWLWNVQDVPRAFPYLLLYYLVEFDLYAIVCPRTRPGAFALPRGYWYLALGLFLIAPIYRFGEFNDLTTKVIMPAQLVFVTGLALALLHAETTPSQQWRRRVLAGLLYIGTLAEIGNIQRALEFGIHGQVPPLARVRHIDQVEPRRLVGQSAAEPDAFFWKYLAKPVYYQPATPLKVVKVWNFQGTDCPDSYKWYWFEREIRRTPAGVRVELPANNALMSIRGLEFNADVVSAVEADITVERADGKTVPYKLVFQWAYAEEDRDTRVGWPFHRWKSSVIYPVTDLPSGAVASNSWWRGRVSALGIYFEIPNAGDELYSVTIREIRMIGGPETPKPAPLQAP